MIETLIAQKNPNAPNNNNQFPLFKRFIRLKLLIVMLF
jgi:hypothetical protein